MALVIVTSTSGGLTQEIRAGDTREHRFTSDEAIADGGANKGPTPYDLLLAALGSCTSMTLHMYARRKNWPLASAEIRLRHDRIHAADCADCESDSGYVDQIEREIFLEGDLTEEQRDRLLYIAEHCPVHKTLVNEIKIRDTLRQRMAA